MEINELIEAITKLDSTLTSLGYCCAEKAEIIKKYIEILKGASAKAPVK